METNTEKPMDTFRAVTIAEEGYGEDCEAQTEEEWFAAFQHLVDTGLAWRLQGWFGRTAMDLIELGHITRPAT